MQRIFHGWLSLALMAGIGGIGLWTIARESVGYAWVYLAVALGGGLLVLGSFCAKCPCRLHGCRHLLFGPLTRFLPRRAEGPYSRLDIALTTVGVVGIFAFPQHWLLHNLPLLIGFWLTAVVLLVEIGWKICPRCSNSFCPVKSGRAVSADCQTGEGE